MTSPTPTVQQVREAIETIRSSYSYDPPERWVRAHQLLRTLRVSLQDQFRPYRWIETLGIVAAFVVLFAIALVSTVALVPLFDWNVLLATVIYATAFSIPGAIIAGSSRLARLLASRRNPIMRLKVEVDHVATRFEDRYAAEYRGQRYDPA